MFNFNNIELYGFCNKIISNIASKISPFVSIMQGAVPFHFIHGEIKSYTLRN
jgi:hypothetical protein